MFPYRKDKRMLSRQRQLGIAVLLLTGMRCLAVSTNAPAYPRRAADILAKAGHLGEPENRRAIVDALHADYLTRRTHALERAKALGLPLRIDLPEGGLMELDVFEDDQPRYHVTHNANAAISTCSDVLRAAPYLATCTNTTIGAWDAGAARPTHQEFGGRVTVKDGCGIYGHSTHVGGTLIASGVQATARGMAVAARLDSYDWNNDLSEMTGRGASAPGQTNALYISNHSYGYTAGWYGTNWYGFADGTNAAAFDRNFGRYGDEVNTLDNLAVNLPYYLVCYSAGNDREQNPKTGNLVTLDVRYPETTTTTYNPAIHPPGDAYYRGGYDTIGFCALAKNILTVSSVRDATVGGVRDLTPAFMTNFPSWGPTDDGRIKPDIVANGQALYSSYSGSDSNYYTLYGTSMACPNAAGTAQQLVAYYGMLFPGQAMRACTLKGLIIHTADERGTSGPDYIYGWGLMNGKIAGELLTCTATNPAIPRLIESSLTSGTLTRSHAFRWDGVSPIRATLCWTDPAGAATSSHDDRTAKLVNDLNLRVTGPTGTQYFPWVMPFTKTWLTNDHASAATTGTNETDNVEQVLIAAPPVAGVYTATVSIATVNTNQYYGLLISGSARPPATLDTISPDQGERNTSMTVTISGTSLTTNTTASLVADGYPTIPIAVQTVSGATNLIGLLDLADPACGSRHLRITHPDGDSAVLSNAFTIVDTLWLQNLDGTVAGWSNSANVGTTYWTLTTSSTNQTPSTAWFAPGPASKSTDNLISESLAIPADATELRLHFWHRYAFENGKDGGVLELSTDTGETWLRAGDTGSGANFLQGGYTGTITTDESTQNSNEFAGQSAWTDATSAFSEVILTLDAAQYAGQHLRIRWRLATNSSTASPGWYVDSIRLTGIKPFTFGSTLLQIY